MDDEQSNYIKVKAATVNMYFNSCLSEKSNTLVSQFPFYLKSDFHVLYQNLGLDSESPIWTYWAQNLKYRNESLGGKDILLSFRFDLPSNKALILKEKYAEIVSEIKFVRDIDHSNKMAFYDKIKHFYLPKNLYLNFDGTERLLRNVGFDYESPYIMEYTSEKKFDEMVLMIKMSICADPEKCTKEEDLKLIFDKNEQLQLNFAYYNPIDNSMQYFKVKFNLYELYYTRENDSDRLLYFNINYREKEDYTSKKSIENFVGLLFLKKINLVVGYNITSENFILYLINDRPIRKIYELVYLYLLIASILISALFMWKVKIVNKGTRRVAYSNFLSDN